MVELRTISRMSRPLSTVSKVECKKSGFNLDEGGPKTTLTEEWYHCNQDDELNLLIYIKNKMFEVCGTKKTLLKTHTTMIRMTRGIC